MWTHTGNHHTAFMWASANAAEPSVPSTATTVTPVTQTMVTASEWTHVINATGSVAAWQEAVIGVEVGGQRLSAVLVQVGDAVKKGQVLAKFNTAVLAAEYAEAKANWITAQANANRVLKLKATGAISAQSIDDYTNQAAVTKARLEVKALQLQYAEVVAPDDGIISASNARLGMIGAAGDELFRLIRQNKLEWRGELTAEQASSISKGQTVILNLPSGKHVAATVRQLAPVFGTETRLITVFADIKPDKTDTVKVGLYIQGDIALSQQTAISVPAQSVVIRDGYHYVFRLNETATQTTARQQLVQIGQTRNGMVQVLSGITAGERIVAKGATYLNDGDSVRVIADGDTP